MADLFWLSDARWAVIGPLMPRNQPGPERAIAVPRLNGFSRGVLDVEASDLAVLKAEDVADCLVLEPVRLTL